MISKSILDRIAYIIKKGEEAIKASSNLGMGIMIVDEDAFVAFRTSGLSLLSSLVGESHVYFIEFKKKVEESYVTHVKSGIHILINIKDELENGWFASMKQIVSGEVFSDFLEMAKYLLDEKYKDPAAVMIGAVLEEHLRQLAHSYSVPVYVLKGVDQVPKKADQLNADLARAGAYNVLEQKNITAWLDLRNKAAHGKYQDYVIAHVEVMYMGVLNFVSTVK